MVEYRIIDRIINRIASKPHSTEPNNEYIQQEKERLKQPNCLSIQNASKVYRNCCSGNVTAINHLNLALCENEKFGLLGFNGSGKSTTFKAVVSEVLLNEGSVNVFGMNIDSKMNDIRKNIGYCPQNHSLFEQLTVGETLKFYLNVKKGEMGLSDVLNMFGLRPYVNTRCINLSGGNKRKLNFAIALMSRPGIALLDEPSTGVDPESRRIMWKVLNEVGTDKQFVMMLSTHSMEEAEILCDRVGWMKDGNFICLGAPERLKLRFSEGYYLQIKFTTLENPISEQLDAVYSLEGFNSKEFLFNSQGPNEQRAKSDLLQIENLLKDLRTLCKRTRFVKFLEGQFTFLIEVDLNKKKELFMLLLSLKVVP